MAVIHMKYILFIFKRQRELKSTNLQLEPGFEPRYSHSLETVLKYFYRLKINVSPPKRIHMSKS